VQTIQEHANRVDSIIMVDEELAASLSFNSIKICNATSTTIQLSSYPYIYEGYIGTTYEIKYVLAFLNNGDLVSAGTHLATWNAPSGEKKIDFASINGYISSILVLNDDELIFACSDFTLNLFDIANARVKWTMETENSDIITSLRLLNDRNLASASMDYTIRIFNLRSQQSIKTLNVESESGPAYSLA
jgi:WD40 repeat protein